jgi:hypothetical protein
MLLKEIIDQSDNHLSAFKAQAKALRDSAETLVPLLDVRIALLSELQANIAAEMDKSPRHPPRFYEGAAAIDDLLDLFRERATDKLSEYRSVLSALDAIASCV